MQQQFQVFQNDRVCWLKKNGFWVEENNQKNGYWVRETLVGNTTFLDGSFNLCSRRGGEHRGDL